MGVFVGGFTTDIAGLKFEEQLTYTKHYESRMKLPNQKIKNPQTFDDTMQMLICLLTTMYKDQPLYINFLEHDLYT